MELKVQFVEVHIQKEDTKGSLASWVHLLLKCDFTRIRPRSCYILYTFKAQGNKKRNILMKAIIAEQDQNSKIILEK